MPYVAVKKELDRASMIENMVLVDPNQYCAIMRTVWNGVVGLNVHRPATRQEKNAAFEIIREQLTLAQELRVAANMKLHNRLKSKLSDDDELK